MLCAFGFFLWRHYLWRKPNNLEQRCSEAGCPTARSLNYRQLSVPALEASVRNHARHGYGGGTFILPSGQEASSTELFHLDGKPHPGTLNPGVMISAKWASPRKLETTGTKDGKDVGVVTYEVSADGKTLTSRYSTSPDQVIVFDRQ